MWNLKNKIFILFQEEHFWSRDFLMTSNFLVFESDTLVKKGAKF